MLTIDKLSKAYLQRGTVLDELSLRISEGDSISVMGPSGSGKTTLLNIIGLLDKPDKGTISFRGRDISSYNENESAAYRNRNIGFVFQEHLLLPHLTVLDNINLPLLAADHSAEEYQSRRSHIADLMERTGITSLAKKHPFQISGGEAQRVALVRALANKPSILLADEPTGSLDENNAEILGDMLVEMNSAYGVTLILATHSASLSSKMKNQLKLHSGRLV